MEPLANTLAVSNTQLEDLKSKARNQDENAIKKAAHEFEAVFLKTVFQSMRKANETLKSSLFDSSGMKMYEDFLDDQFAQEMSKKGLGLGDFLMRQLSKK